MKMKNVLFNSLLIFFIGISTSFILHGDETPHGGIVVHAINGYNIEKVKGIKSLAKQILDKSFNPRLIPKMSDEEAIIYLSQLRQIGRWSAEMILLFTYNRSNIWPIQDIGLLRGISKNYKKKYLPPESYVKLLNKRFSPYCSVATWYLWRSIDPEPIQY